MKKRSKSSKKNQGMIVLILLLIGAILLSESMIRKGKVTMQTASADNKGTVRVAKASTTTMKFHKVNTDISKYPPGEMPP